MWEASFLYCVTFCEGLSKIKIRIDKNLSRLLNRNQQVKIKEVKCHDKDKDGMLEGKFPFKLQKSNV